LAIGAGTREELCKRSTGGYLSAQSMVGATAPWWGPQLSLGAGGRGERVRSMVALGDADGAEPPMQGGLLTSVWLGEKLVPAGFL